MKPQRVYEAMNRALDTQDTCYVAAIGLTQIAAAQFLHVYRPRHWINCGQAGPLGWTIPAALGVRAADPARRIVGISGDYDFQFLIEELAVGAQFKLPYLHILLNNAYLGLIRQAQRNFDMDYCVSLAFDNVNSHEAGGYGVDHVKVVEGLGCKAIRVQRPEEFEPAVAQAQRWMDELRVPVVIEVIVERVTNVAMGTEIDAVMEFDAVATPGRRRAYRGDAARVGDVGPRGVTRLPGIGGRRARVIPAAGQRFANVPGCQHLRRIVSSPSFASPRPRTRSSAVRARSPWSRAWRCPWRRSAMRASSTTSWRRVESIEPDGPGTFACASRSPWRPRASSPASSSTWLFGNYVDATRRGARRRGAARSRYWRPFQARASASRAARDDRRPRPRAHLAAR